uniref:Claudin n=1 Tax=Sphaeramia orbicularis TaxID=375764 RepID=A0A673BMR3_9TELE
EDSPVLVSLLGVLVLGGAWLCSLATTLMSTWLTMCPDLLPTVTFELGLWEACVIHEGGTQGCQPHSSLLGLPPDIQLARILMCLSLAAGLLALLVAVPGMTGVKSCGERLRWKRALRTAGGALGLAAGVLGLAPVSYVAHLTVERFFDESVPEVMPRWEFGDAMFCGWTAGVLHLLAGTLLLASGRCAGGDDWSRPAPVSAGYPKTRTGTGTRTGTRTSTRSEYV